MNTDAEIWQSPASDLTFPSDRIDIWRVGVESFGQTEQDGRAMLAPDEVARASRFHFERDRSRYIRGRTALRMLLGRYLGVAPGEIGFRYAKYGKPELVPPCDSRNLQFNVSDSGGVALIAVGAGRTLGVDIELLRPMPDLLKIATRFFSAREVEALLALSEDTRHEAFFACWTRKEAFLKATGVGLSYPLADFSVSVNPREAAKLVEIKGEEDSARCWFLVDVFPGEGFRGALASEGKGCRICHLIFDPLWVGFR